MKVPALALWACATAAPVFLLETAAEDAAAFNAMTVADVSSLLADWNLFSVFGAQFAEAGVDGEALLHASEGELTHAFGGVAQFHWNRLFRKLAPVWNDNSATVAEEAENEEKQQRQRQQPQDSAVVGTPAARPQHRQLADGDNVVAGVPLNGYSGIRINKENAVVQLCVLLHCRVACADSQGWAVPLACKSVATCMHEVGRTPAALFMSLLVRALPPAL